MSVVQNTHQDAHRTAADASGLISGTVPESGNKQCTPGFRTDMETLEPAEGMLQTRPPDVIGLTFIIVHK
jgi:hypothetical protein